MNTSAPYTAADSKVWPDGNDEEETNMMSPFVEGRGRSMIVFMVIARPEELSAVATITVASLNRRISSMPAVVRKTTATITLDPPNPVTCRINSVSQPARYPTVNLEIARSTSVPSQPSRSTCSRISPNAMPARISPIRPATALA